MFKSILWPVDGSPLSVRPLQAVIDLARLSRATVVLLSVAEPRLYRASDAASVQAGNEAETMRLEAARHELERIRAAVRRAGLACDDVVALSPLPGEAIVDTARKAECDLIVMATHGRMGVLDTLLNASVTQDVLKASTVPVLVFP
jgi:nucleotide-binding universal stress UspA family protein